MLITVQPQDTPMRIAQRFVGDGSRFEELVVANPQVPSVTLPDGRVTFASGAFVPGLLLRVPNQWLPAGVAQDVQGQESPTLLNCPSGMHTECFGEECRCIENQSTSGTTIAVIAIAGVLVVGLIGLGFYQAHKGIRPVVVAGGPAYYPPVYL